MGPPPQTVSDVMRRDFISVGPGESLLEADSLMRMARIRHLLVIDGGTLVGILSHRDLLEARHTPYDGHDAQERRAHLRSLSVARVMRTAPETVRASTPLAEAAGLMLRMGIGCLPVVDDGGRRAIGLVTESDLLRAAYSPAGTDAVGRPAPRPGKP